jgi:hypothetical protein
MKSICEGSREPVVRALRGQFAIGGIVTVFRSIPRTARGVSKFR